MSIIATRDGTEIYYKDWGAGQPVVLSHGWSLSGDAWESRNSVLKIYPGAPHGLVDTHKEQLNGDLLAFIKGIVAP